MGRVTTPMGYEDLENILKNDLKCPCPFDDEGKLTESGKDAYNRLVDTIYAICAIGETDERRILWHLRQIVVTP